MANKNITPKERNLLKGAIRRVFSRSELRKRVLATADIEHIEATRPRVKKWSRCTECKKPTPKYLMQVDHVDPIVPIETTLEDMSWDTVIDRAWCDDKNLNPMCKDCHKAKTKLEQQQRRLAKKRKTGI